MKKFLVVVLAVLVAVSTMPMTVLAASEPAKFDFAGFEMKENGDGVVVDFENKVIYGFTTTLQVSALNTYIEKGADVDSMYVCENYGTDEERVLGDTEFIGTGKYVVLVENGVEYPFEFVIFGDVNGDSACDALDAFYISKVSNNRVEAPTDVATKMAATSPDMFEEDITDATYQTMVNNALASEGEVDQNKGENANTVESVIIDDQVYTGAPVKVDGDVEILFNSAILSDEHYEIVEDSYVRNIDQTTGKEKASVTLRGKGLFAGEIVVEFEIVGLLYDIVNEVNAVIEEAQLSDVIKAVYVNNEDVDTIDIVLNASKAIRGDFDVNMSALNGLLARIDEYRAEKLPGLNLVVDEFALASNGSFSRADVKNFVFDLVSGAFCELANAKTNTIKSYAGEISTTDVNAEKFNVNLVVEEDYAGDIDRVKAFSAKIARYVSFDVVDGNAVINVAMPASFSAKVVEILGRGDVDVAVEEFNNMTVATALIGYLAKVDANDISAGSAKEIEQAIKVAAMLGDFVNKGLGEIASATVTSNNATMPLLSGRGFAINDSSIAGLVEAVAYALSDEVLASNVGSFYNNGIYTVAADVELDYKGIKETIIVNLDLFTAAVETPTVIEETATYFSDIIADLGISNAVAVSYDKDGCRALATLDARELVTNFNIDESAFDGLYTDVKGYFDDNYGTATIVVDGKEIVTAGQINKTALKDLIFSAATGFFQDAANLDVNNVIRSMDTVVTEADGTVHGFDLDFALVGDPADIERVANIADKVADYVSFEVVNGNAVVNVGVPEGMRAKIIAKLGGDAETAQALFNESTVAEALIGYVAKVEPSDISASNAAEIQAIIDMVAKVDAVVNKVLGKVESSIVYDVNGNATALLSDRGFTVNDASIAGLVEAAAVALSDEVLQKGIVNFMNEDGTYTVKCDVALSIGGIKETVIVNLDIFGDYEKKNAVEDTVDYADSILKDLGVESFASVELKDGKAIATFDASALLADGLDSFNEDAIDGLYTDVKDYFYANFGDSTIKVGDYELVTAGVINKAAVKDVIFDFATGFFTNVANMDSNTIKSYNTVVVDGDGNVEEFAFDFNLGGEAAHIEKLQTIAGKVAELVSFSEVDGNAAVAVSLPAGVKSKMIDKLGGEEKAREIINDASVAELLIGYIGKMETTDISTTYADNIQTAIEMIAKVDGVVNKVVNKVENGVAYDVNGNAYQLIGDYGFVVNDASIAGLVEAFACALNEEILTANVEDFMNDDGTYTIDCVVTVKGITEKVSITLDIF